MTEPADIRSHNHSLTAPSDKYHHIILVTPAARQPTDNREQLRRRN